MSQFKPLMLTAIVAGSMLFLSACNGHSSQNLSSNKIQSDSVEIPNDSLPDSVQLSEKVAGSYVRNFGNMAASGKSGLKAIPATRYYWLSLKRLNAIVRLLNKEKGADGVRLYFATYDTAYTAGFKNAPPKKYWGHNTLVIISTRDSSGAHADFYTDTPKAQRLKPVGFIFTDPQNRGEICPPPSNCYTSGAYLLPNN